MTSNRAAVMPEIGSLEIRDVPLPTPLPVPMRIDAAGGCGSDTACHPGSLRASGREAR